MNTCRKCGGKMIGEGHTEPIRCEFATGWEDKEPDCLPIECEFLHEGDPCNQPGCPGVIETKAVENCSCHISPPCGACTSACLICNTCGYEVPE